MKKALKLIFHPPPEVERFDTGLRYTDILFGFVIKELFVRLQNWEQLDAAVRWHLIVGATLVLGSWIGYRRSLYRSGYQLKFFNLPLFRFIVDQMMLIVYFRVAVLTDVSGKVVLGAVTLAKHTTELVMYVFILYFVWDLLGIWLAKAKIKVDSSKPLYPVVKDFKMTDEVQKINWGGFLITVASLVLFVGLWLLADYFNPNWLFLVTTLMLLCYRWAKEIRTSCQSPQQI